jgi:serine phosphatase RsbU (regulator of sigma subunit)
MMSYKSFLKLIFCFGFICSSLLLSSQNQKLDSLLTLLKNQPSKADTKKATILLSVCELARSEKNKKELFERYTLQLMAVSTQLDFKKGKAYALFYLGILKSQNAENDKAFTYTQQSLKAMQDIKDKKGISSCLQELGRLSAQLRKHDEAIQYYLRAIQAHEALTDTFNIALCLERIGTIYEHIGNYEQALNYYFKTLRYSELAQDQNRTCEAYICIGIVFYNQGNYNETIKNMNKAQVAGGVNISKQNLIYIYNNLAISYSGLKNLKKALEYNFKTLKLVEELKDDMGFVMSCGNIGSMYVELKNLKEGLKYYLKAIERGEKINYGVGLTYSYNGIGSCYLEMNQPGLAITYYTKALNKAREINYKSEVRTAYLLLSNVYEQQKNYKEALRYHKLYGDLKDSILNEESLKQTTELNVRYETDKKAKEILLLTKDQELKDKTIQQQRLVRIGLLIGLGLFLALSFVLLNRYRFKQRANLILEKQKQEIHQKNVLITDSIDYAKTIQEAILPDDEKLAALFPEYFILYKPKAIVSGDFYWIGKKENEIICAVADCTGHGVPGAFMSLLGHNILENVISKETISNPGTILTALNQEILARFSKNQESAKHGMDIAIISINYSTQQFQYAGAKNSVYHVRENILQEIKADKFSTGTVMKDHSFLNYTNHSQPLQKGDMIYLFSDGFPDQKGGAEKKKLFYQPFKDLLVSISMLPDKEQKKRLDDFITNWIGTGEQMDDILVMGIRYV